MSPAASSSTSQLSSIVRAASGAAAVCAGAAAATLAYAHFIELNRFQVRTERLEVLPAGSEEIRILHISDMHMIPGQKRKTEFMHSLAELQPDLVINTGDNLSHVEGLDPLLRALDPLMDFPGVFVPGSNCYFAPIMKNPARYLWKESTSDEGIDDRRVALPFERMHAEFESRGWRGLINRYDDMELKGTRIFFSGVDDPHLDYDRHPGFSPAAWDAPESSVRLGVAHAPYMRTLDRFVDDGAQAIFAGHTHGGQVCLPGGHALVSNCDLPPARAKGVSFTQDVPVQISAGLGTSRFAQVRLFCPPEAVLVTLAPRAV